MARIRSTATLASAAALLAGTALAQSDAPVEQGAPNVPEFGPAFPEQTRAPASESGVQLAVETVAEGLEHPWGIAVLDADRHLVTERPGRLRVIEDGALREEPVAGLPEVFAEEQGGLLDIAVGPDFAEDRMIYWTYAKPVEGGSATAASRGRLSENLSEVTEVEDIFVQEPASESPLHYGSRIVFDGQGHAFITTGERYTEEERVFAQDLDKTYGKVIRVRLDGATPEENPFADVPTAIGTIWSYGHRNIQGADIHPETGALWIADHGPQGGDELVLVEPGANHGWPIISYGEDYDGSEIGEGATAAEGLEQPNYYWDPVIAPAGMAFYEGALFEDWSGDLLISSLNPGALVRIELDGERVAGEERLLTDRGRIRDVAIAEDGAILVVTDFENGALLRLTPED